MFQHQCCLFFCPLQSEIGFGKLETYIKLDKLGEVRDLEFFVRNVKCGSFMGQEQKKINILIFGYYEGSWEQFHARISAKITAAVIF